MKAILFVLTPVLVVLALSVVPSTSTAGVKKMVIKTKDGQQMTVNDVLGKLRTPGTEGIPKELVMTPQYEINFVEPGKFIIYLDKNATLSANKKARITAENRLIKMLGIPKSKLSLIMLEVKLEQLGWENDDGSYSQPISK